MLFNNHEIKTIKINGNEKSSQLMECNKVSQGNVA
jgi:hypothetical protein